MPLRAFASKLASAMGRRTPGAAAGSGPMERYGRYVDAHYDWYRDEHLLALQSEYFGSASGTIKDRYFNLYHLARLSRPIPGDTVECGVFHGFGSFLILHAVDDPKKIHHAFDSFEGLPEPAEIDVVADAPYVWKRGDLAADVDAVRERLERFPNLVLHQGWIPDTFVEMDAQALSFVHIDVDLHQPTVDSLEFLWDRISPGGVTLFDDYASRSCPGHKKAVDDFFADRREEVIRLSTSQAFVIKGSPVPPGRA